MFTDAGRPIDDYPAIGERVHPIGKVQFAKVAAAERTFETRVWATLLDAAETGDFYGARIAEIVFEDGGHLAGAETPEDTAGAKGHVQS